MVAAGRMLLHYRIVEKIGEGGMGVVWKAHDTALDRPVAIKILPTDLCKDRDRLLRFEREAKLLASLQHAHVASIYGLHAAGDLRFLAMELVQGEDLSRRVRRGPLSIEETLRIGRQVAEGLGAAHERGIVHRDLKPANIRIGSDKMAKILDFGLARRRETAPEADPSSAPTQVGPRTQTGVVLGTVDYMSPEQARGEEVDRRTDIWAFGCVIYECLTGRSAFRGATAAETLGNILHKEPDWSALPEGIPSALRALLRRCLSRDPRRRLHDIADARIVLEEEIAGTSPPDATTPAAARVRRRRGWAVAAVGIGGLLAGIVLAVVWMPRGPAPRPVRMEAALGEGRRLQLETLPSIAISPDGSRVIFAATEAGVTRLYQRPIESFEATPVPNTDGAEGPFFSPDGGSIAFFAAERLRKVVLTTGSKLDICEAPGGRGGTWGQDDTIVFTPRFLSGLHRVHAGGGEPETLTQPDPSRGENEHIHPSFIPGRRAVLFTIWSGGGSEGSRVAVLTLDDGRIETLLEGASSPLYVPPGYLLFLRGHSLAAAPFDIGTLRLTGTVVPVLDGAMVNADQGVAQIAVSTTGTLVYAAGEPWGGRSHAILVAPDGAEDQITDAPGDYWYPRLSPDGHRVAIAVSEGKKTRIDVIDLETRRAKRLTTEGNSALPVWSPDGEWIAFTSDRGGSWDLYRQRVEDDGPADRLIDPGGASGATGSRFPSSWSPDGARLTFTQEDSGGRSGVAGVAVDSGRVEILVSGAPSAAWATFSPDGRWIAYQSNETGAWEVYVRSANGTGSRHRVSRNGGSMPLWSGDGDQLHYVHGGAIRTIRAIANGAVRPGEARTLYTGSFVDTPRLRNFDIAPSGALALIRLEEVDPPDHLRIVTGWLADLDRILAGR